MLKLCFNVYNYMYTSICVCGQLAADSCTKVFSNSVTPDPAQARSHPKITIADSDLPLNRCPKILSVHLDTSLSYATDCEQVASRIRYQRTKRRRSRLYSQLATKEVIRVIDHHLIATKKPNLTEANEQPCHSYDMDTAGY